MPERFYVTTPIYYVNDIPHLGTAYTTIISDALRRFHGLVGHETFMLTGTDEHGQKIERQAKEENLDPKAFCDKISERFKDAWPALEIGHDRFIRTTDPDHEQFVKNLWLKIRSNGNNDLYLSEFEGWYCVGCEDFKTEKELKKPGNVCPLHKKPVERVKEPSYFFALSKYESRLLEFYDKHPGFIQPTTRRNEVLSFVKGGLKDISVSRTTFTWGIPVPDDPKHVMYVWFDALANYRSALGEGELARFWAPNARVVHLMGKDILRFHAVLWPAFLMAAGYADDALPSVIYAHGFLTVDGQKMSKSLRNSVDPLRLAKELGADVLRYQLLRAISFGQDGDFDHAAMLERYNADLGKNLGNLLSRVLGLCAKMTEGKVPADDPTTDTALEADLFQYFDAQSSAARTQWTDLAPHAALEATWSIASKANEYVDRTAPWALAKNGDHARVSKVLARLLGVLESLSVMIWPAMPKKSDEMRAQLGLAPLATKIDDDQWPAKIPVPTPGRALNPSGALFPTFDADRTKELLDKLAPKPTTNAAPAAARHDTIPAPALFPAEPSAPAEITYDQFAAIDLRVGVVATCERVPKKDKLLKLTVDLGEAEPRQIVAGLALSFTPEALVGRKVIVVANLAPRDFGKGLVSHGMLLATGPSDALTLATVDERAASTGGEGSGEGNDREVNAGMRLK